MRSHTLPLLLLALFAASVCAEKPRPEAGFAARCETYANPNRHGCLKKQLALSSAALAASMSAVRRMMAQWDDTPQRKRAQANFEQTAVDFERYKRTQCEYAASMRYGVADDDEIGIARLECMLRLNGQRTRMLTDLTATVVI